jgi:hypothetical protein
MTKAARDYQSLAAFNDGIQISEPMILIPPSMFKTVRP